MDSKSRSGVSAVFALLAIAAIFTVTAGIPEGPWVGMYKSFIAVWVAVGLALLLLLILIQTSDISWSIVLIGAVFSALIIVNLSRLWGVTLGVRDPFRHLYLIRTNTFSFGANFYPVFHIFARTLADITSINQMTILGATPLISSIIGVGLLALVLRRLGLEKRVQQTAVVAGIPIVAAGPIARPYTLGVVYILLFVWIVTADIRNWSIQALLLVAAFGFLWVHPVPFFVGSAVIVTAILARLVLDRHPISIVQPPPAGWWARLSLGAVLVAALVIHMFVFTGLGASIVNQVTESVDSGPSELTETPPSQNGDSSDGSDTTTQQGPSDGQQGSSDGQQPNSASASSDRNAPLILQIQSNLSEFILRALLGLLLLGVSAIVALREIIDKKIHYLTTILGICGTLVLFLFIIIDISPISTFGPRRALSFAPILLFPLLARALRTQTVIRLLVAGLVLTSGMAIVYDSPAVTGGVQSGATTAQVQGYEWYHEHGSAPVTGSQSTFWIAEGLFGQATEVAWGNGSAGKIRWKERSARHPWQVTGRSDHVVAISGYERALSQHRAREDGITQPLTSLNRFQRINQRFYDNGNLRFYHNETIE